MGFMDIFNAIRSVPANAKKKIAAGRLKDMTDIQPIWRIMTLTEQFGPVGFGWNTEVTDKIFKETANGETAVFVDILLYIKVGEEWSKPIFGTGGSKFITNERNGPYVNDECVKMAYTDAISVACKSLGMGADVYWAAGSDSKYNTQPDDNGSVYATPEQIKTLTSVYKGDTMTKLLSANGITRIEDLSCEKASILINVLKAKAAEKGTAT